MTSLSLVLLLMTGKYLMKHQRLRYQLRNKYQTHAFILKIQPGVFYLPSEDLLDETSDLCFLFSWQQFTPTVKFVHVIYSNVDPDIRQVLACNSHASVDFTTLYIASCTWCILTKRGYHYSAFISIFGFIAQIKMSSILWLCITWYGHPHRACCYHDIWHVYKWTGP